jgi:hypothetical protein
MKPYVLDLVIFMLEEIKWNWEMLPKVTKLICIELKLEPLSDY